MGSQRTRRDSEERFQQLWDAHHEHVARFASRRLAGDDEVADVVADTYLAAWRHIDRIETATERAWLLGTARKQMANRLRGRRRQAALAKRVAAEPTMNSNAVTEGAANGRQALSDAFNSLEASDREAIALVTWEELSPAEAAQVLGIPAVRFRVRLHRAKTRLREELGAGQASAKDQLQPLESHE